MNIVEFDSGPGATLYAVMTGDGCMVREFISTLTGTLDEKQVFAVFNLILLKGDPHNEKKFRHIGDQIYEIKTNSGIRILCFKSNSFKKNSIILTHGFRKPKQKILMREKEKSLLYYQDYILGNITIIEE